MQNRPERVFSGFNEAQGSLWAMSLAEYRRQKNILGWFCIASVVMKMWTLQSLELAVSHLPNQARVYSRSDPCAGEFWGTLDFENSFALIQWSPRACGFGAAWGCATIQSDRMGAINAGQIHSDWSQTSQEKGRECRVNDWEEPFLFRNP